LKSWEGTGNFPGFAQGEGLGGVPSQRVKFGDFAFDLRSELLFSGHNEVRLTPKAAAVLKVLLGAAGTPVSKAELFAAVWTDTVVSDDALTSIVQEIRKALGDDSKRPRFIETRHRRGYCFVAPVAGAPGESPSPSGIEAAGVSAIAVLPFADMSPERDQDYLCEGLAEELIGALTQIDGLRVAARTASFQFRAGGADVREVGRRLGVGALLEGSVRKSGDRLRVTVQLVETVTGFHRWSQRFDRALDDVFSIQDEIAESVAATLRGSVLSQREKEALLRPHTGTVAYEYYLRGRQRLSRMTRPDLLGAAEMFERAIELDARYAPAWAGLATVHATLYEWFGAGGDDLASAESSSEKALQLAPGLAEAHVARGMALSLTRRHVEAAREFDEAIRINPNLFDAYYSFARTSFARGETQRSVELFRKASEVRPEDFRSPIFLAQSLRKLGAAEEARKANRDGILRAEQMLALNPSNVRALALGSRALFEDGQVERAMEWSKRSIELYPEDLATLVVSACIHAKANRQDEALDLLERAFARGWGQRDWVERDPDYDTLRDHPRFRKLLAKLK
jgi:adenylate cyclase